jgi:hypothetical protein
MGQKDERDVEVEVEVEAVAMHAEEHTADSGSQTDVADVVEEVAGPRCNYPGVDASRPGLVRKPFWSLTSTGGHEREFNQHVFFCI